MEKKDIDAIYNLMQNVSDKLGHITDKIESKINNQPKNDCGNQSKVDQLIAQQKISHKYLNYLKQSIEEKNKTTIEPKNNYHEYVLFGKDSSMNNSRLFTMICTVLIFWLGFKYIAPIVFEKEKIELENSNYKMMYCYLYLKGLRNESLSVPINLLMDQIQTKDSSLLNEFSTLVNSYEKKKRRIELENELEKLE